MVRKNQISVGHARAVLSRSGAEAQIEAARRIVRDSLTVRNVENIAKSEKSGGETAKPKPEVMEAEDPIVAGALERLRYKFGSPVRLKVVGEGKGRVEIEYFSESDLARLFDILLGDGTESVARMVGS